MRQAQRTPAAREAQEKHLRQIDTMLAAYMGVMLDKESFKELAKDIRRWGVNVENFPQWNWRVGRKEAQAQ